MKFQNNIQCFQVCIDGDGLRLSGPSSRNGYKSSSEKMYAHGQLFSYFSNVTQETVLTIDPYQVRTFS